jgi:hypothetical protein
VIARTRIAVALLVAAFGVAGCSTPSPPTDTGMGDMPGMVMPTTAAALAEAAPEGTGLADGTGGYVFVPTADTVPAGAPSMFSFHITGPGGRTVTRYQPHESQLVQFDLIRADLTNYVHIDPAMREDGTWVVPLPALPPGSYRAYTTFAAPDASAGKPLLYRLSHAFIVPGNPPVSTPLPAPMATVTVDGFTVTVAGRPKGGTSTPLTIDIRKDGQPVGYFQRYLDGYAHLTAFHAGDLAIARLSPADKVTGRQELTSQAVFPVRGTWRLFVQFRISGPPHTAVFTVAVG